MKSIVSNTVPAKSKAKKSPSPASLRIAGEVLSLPTHQQEASLKVKPFDPAKFVADSLSLVSDIVARLERAGIVPTDKEGVAKASVMGKWGAERIPGYSDSQINEAVKSGVLHADKVSKVRMAYKLQSLNRQLANALSAASAL